MNIVVLNVKPVGKPRMTRSDKWKLNPYHPDPRRRQRPAVTQWFAFQTEIRNEARKQGLKLDATLPYLVFHLPMPDSWSKKKRLLMIGKPHQQKPDGDNLEKAVMDSLHANDCEVWDFRGKKKIWDTLGYIEVHVE
jgi:Holliday junction resolvase RusA-like endonuclease